MLQYNKLDAMPYVRKKACGSIQIMFLRVCLQSYYDFIFKKKLYRSISKKKKKFFRGTGGLGDLLVATFLYLSAVFTNVKFVFFLKEEEDLFVLPSHFLLILVFNRIQVILLD